MVIVAGTAKVTLSQEFFLLPPSTRSWTVAIVILFIALLFFFPSCHTAEVIKERTSLELLLTASSSSYLFPNSRLHLVIAFAASGHYGRRTGS